MAIAEEAAILTGIGIVTAFGLLVILMLIILMVRMAVERILRVATPGVTAAPVGSDAEARNKALAAVIAVTAVRAASHAAGSADDDV